MSTHKVTILFEDGRSVAIDAQETDTIYLSALKNRVRIETDCLEGACATCKALCTQGEYYLDDYSDEALSDEEAARRELREETGYGADRFERIGTIQVNPAFMTNACATVLAHGARLEGATQFDEHEEIAIERVSLGEFFAMIDDGRIDHGIVVAAAHYLSRHLARG